MRSVLQYGMSLRTRVGSVTSFQFNYNYNYNYALKFVNYITITIILCQKYQITITFTLTDYKLKLQILLRIWKCSGNRLIEHRFIEHTAYSGSFGWKKWSYLFPLINSSLIRAGTPLIRAVRRVAAPWFACS